jgi:hypothetical protein
LSLVMERPAREALRRRRAGRHEAIRRIRADAQCVMTPERQARIEDALRVRRAKSRVLRDLKDDDRRRLYALAVKKMLRQGDG